MQRYFTASMFLLALTLVFFINGCGSSSSTTDTTTTTTVATTSTTTTSTTTTTGVSVSAVDAAKSSALLASGGSSAGSSAASLSTAASSGSSIYGFMVRAMATNGPPDTFFTVAVTGEGFIPLTSEAVGGNMTPYIRQLTYSGRPVTTEVLSGKKIAILGTWEVRDSMSGGPGSGSNPRMLAGVASFTTEVTSTLIGGLEPYTSSECYRSLTTLGDYNAWVSRWFYINAGPGFPRNFTTPEVTQADTVGSIEVKMVFARDITGEMRVILTTVSSTDSGPRAGTYSSPATTIQIPTGTMIATASMIFTGTSGNITMEGLSLTGTTSPDGYSMWSLMNPMTNIGTGIVTNDAGTTLGTFEFTPSAGTFYPVTGTATNFAF